MHAVDPSAIRDADFAAIRSSDVIEDVVDRLRLSLSNADFASWRRQVLDLAPLGNVALLDLADASISCLGKFGVASMLKLGETCLHVGELADDDTARMLLRTASIAVHHAGSAASHSEYLDALVTVARQMPYALPGLLDRQADILPVLDARNMRHWIGAGLAISVWDKERAQAYFKLESDEAKRLLSQMNSDVTFDDVAASVGAILKALWNLSPIIVGLSEEAMPNGPRTSFFGSFVRVPKFYPGTSGNAAVHLFRGALAHIAAHMVHGHGPVPVRKLKPVQVALISLIEDARVENLAAEELPGLGKLWASLHTASPSAAVTVDKLLARLARALADPDYRDDNPWVEKGRRLFFEQRGHWAEENFSRALGGALGHDLGQMRIPFNAKTYVVQPSYRDDNSGLWERRPDDDSGETDESEAIIDGPSPTPKSPDDTKDKRSEATEVAVAEREGVLAGRYPEWDYQSGDHRRSWTAVHSYQPNPAPDEAAGALMAGTERTIGRIETLIRSARVGRPRPLKAQRQGDMLDLDACIRLTIERRAGHTPDGRYHQLRAVDGRSLSIFVLLDISHSTRDRIGTTTETIIGMERKAVALLATAIQRVGDPFAIAGFCSDGRNDVRFYEVKDFGQEFDLACRRRLGGLRGMLSTRLGAALRHSGAQLARQRSERRLVLVVTDGEPSDIDVADGRYLVEDARHAVHELNHAGIDVFAVALGSEGRSSLPRMFSRHGYVVIGSIEQLPRHLTKIYHRLAG